MAIRTAQFLAIILTALALVPGGAHLFALPNKIGMSREAYFTAQQIYAGWALLGAVLFAALFADLALAIATRSERRAFIFALVGVLCLAANLAIFFAFTFPANQATANWMQVPDNWEALRAQWEYSHAVNAAVTFVALCCVVLATLSQRR